MRRRMGRDHDFSADAVLDFGNVAFRDPPRLIALRSLAGENRGKTNSQTDARRLMRLTHPVWPWITPGRAVQTDAASSEAIGTPAEPLGLLSRVATRLLHGGRATQRGLTRTT